MKKNVLLVAIDQEMFVKRLICRVKSITFPTEYVLNSGAINTTTMMRKIGNKSYDY